MSDEWTFWREQLAGLNPETTPGTPQFGYFVAKEYVSIPGGAKRVLTDTPVAIWSIGDEWHALITKPTREFAVYGKDNVDEIFARCCRNAIAFDEYKKSLAQIGAWRNGNENWRDAA